MNAYVSMTDTSINTSEPTTSEVEVSVTPVPEEDDFVPASVGDNAYDELRREFFREAYRKGKSDGAGTAAKSDFSIELAGAAAHGILAVKPPKAKKGEKQPKADSVLAWERYLKGKNKLLADELERNAGVVQKEVSNCELFIRLGAALGVDAHDKPHAVTMLNEAREIMNEQARVAAQASKEDNVPTIKGGTYENLRKLAVENLRSEEGVNAYTNDDGEGIRPMNSDEILGTLLPDVEPKEKSELDLLKPVHDRLQDIGSKFQSPELDQAAFAVMSRMRELQVQQAAEDGFELKLKDGELMTDKQMKALRDASRIASRI